MQVPMSAPDIGEEEIAAVNAVLRTPYLSIGPQIVNFEEAMARRFGVRNAIGVNSGTSGLHLCVIAAGVQAGDLVLTSPFSFVASANAILYERAIPLFVDVDPTTGNISPEAVASAANDISQGGEAAERLLPPALRGARSAGIGRLRAILPVHAFGQPADMLPILETARKHDLLVIEDACEAIGAEYMGQPAGTIGDGAVFAFYPNKQMTTGEGGIIITNRHDWAELCRSLRNQGRDVFDAWLNHTRLGYNYRLDEMSAALGLAQLGRLDALLAQREKVAGQYNERLAGLDGVETPVIAPTTTRMSWFVYTVRIMHPMGRELVMQKLQEAGIPSRPYFTPIHLQPFYRQSFGYERGDFPVTEYLGDVTLALPFSGVMTEQQVDYVCDTLRNVIREGRSSQMKRTNDGQTRAGLNNNSSYITPRSETGGA
ncbi:MAG: DegT/DnrJ/EryC1/StrS family aminotransferase [Chloroflexota bacterium]